MSSLKLISLIYYLIKNHTKSHLGFLDMQKFLTSTQEFYNLGRYHETTICLKNCLRLLVIYYQ